MDPDVDLRDEEKEKEVEMEEEEGDYQGLMTAMAKMGKKQRSKSQLRSEPGKVSEFGLSASSEKGVQLDLLLSSLEKTQAQADLKRQLKNLYARKKTLDVPLYAHEAQKIQRKVAYTKVSKDIGKWDQVVKTNRRAEHISFPLNQNKIGIQSTEEFAKRFKPSTPLEEEVYQLLNGNKYAENKDKELTRAEEEVLSAMSLEEAQIRRAELQKARALQSYYESKCKRQKRIKSKKYHRIKKKAKAKEEAKNMEELMKTDPEAAEEHLMKMEKVRAEERMSLRHKNTSKWAKGMIRFGKYSEEARQKIADQLEHSRNLTQKIASINESDDEDAIEESDQNPVLSLSDINNPWFTGENDDKEKDQKDEEGKDKGPEFSLPQAVEAEKDDTMKEKVPEKVTIDEVDKELERLQARRRFRKQKQSLEENKNLSSEESEEEGDENKMPKVTGFEENEKHKDDKVEGEDGKGLEEGLLNEETTRRNTEEELEEIEEEIIKPNTEAEMRMDNRQKKVVSKGDEVNVDVTKVFTVESKPVITMAPEIVEGEEGTVEDDDHLMNIQEAFEDDDVVEAFKDEKEGVIEKGKPKPVDLTLPGWGEWGGTGIKVSEAKRRRFTKPAPPAAPRRDDNLHHVIINENRDRKLAEHQVNDVPFPYASVEQFQRSIRAPIGRTWNTPSAVAKLTKPSYSTKIGTIIEPIQEEVLKKEEETSRKRNLPKPDLMFAEPKATQGKGKHKRQKMKRKAVTE